MAKKPVHEIRFGYIKVTVWKKSGERFNVNFARSDSDYSISASRSGRPSRN